MCFPLFVYSIYDYLQECRRGLILAWSIDHTHNDVMMQISAQRSLVLVVKIKMAFAVENRESFNTSCDVLPSGIIFDEPSFFQSSCTGCKDDIDNIISAPDDVFHHPDVVEDDEKHLRQTTTQMDIGSTTRQGYNEADVSSALNGNCIMWTKSLKDFPPLRMKNYGTNW